MMSLRFTAILLTIIIVFMSIFAKFITATKGSIAKVASSITQNMTINPINPNTFEFKDSKRLPIFFFSHGGPTFGDREAEFGSDKGAWDQTKAVGDFIKKTVRPDFIIVVSAHWQANGFTGKEVEVSIPNGLAEPGETEVLDEMFGRSGPRSVKLNREIDNELIYDFYGFPAHHYRSQFHTFGNKAISYDIVDTLIKSGFDAKVANRGLDHGNWVPLRVAFGNTKVADTQEYDVNVPLIQVSLPSSTSMDASYELGEALSRYRDLNGQIIFSGMSVHNLRDMGRAFQLGGKALPYAESFNRVLSNILTSSDIKTPLLDQLKQIEKNQEWKKLYRASHPTNEHFLPVIVGAGASQNDSCVELYSTASGSLGWNIYEWSNTSSKM